MLRLGGEEQTSWRSVSGGNQDSPGVVTLRRSLQYKEVTTGTGATPKVTLLFEIELLAVKLRKAVSTAFRGEDS
jgi:FKBP-type peptidyl-prolyl cis-trans isomerase